MTLSPVLTDRNFHLLRSFYPHIVEFAERSFERLLDLGCGEQPFINVINADEYIGIDLSPEDQPDIVGDAMTLPFRDNSFDAILSTQVLEHVPDPVAFFEELKRVLRPGGTGLVTTNQMYPLHEKPHDYFRFTRYGLSHLATEAGFDIEEIIEIGTLPMRAVCEVNYTVSKLPFPMVKPARAVVNVCSWPIVGLSPREEYIVTGVKINNPPNEESGIS